MGGTSLKVQSALDDAGDEDFEDSDEEWEKQQKIFAKLGPKLHSGKVLSADEMKEFGIDDDEDEDDDDDEDYEYNGGDMSLYESAIDELDEIMFLKQAIGQIHAQDQNLYQRLLGGVSDPSQAQKFQDLMNGIDDLITKEKTVREQIEALEKANKSK